MNPFGALFGGGLSASGGAGGDSGPATSGPSNTGQSVSTTNGFQYNSNFTVAGSGSKVSATNSGSQDAKSNAANTSSPTQSQAVASGAGQIGGSNNLPIYIALGVLGLVVIATSLRRS